MLGALNDGWRSLCRPSYGNAGWNLRCVFDVVREISGALSAALPDAKRAELRALCEALRLKARSACIEDSLGDAATLFP